MARKQIRNIYIIMDGWYECCSGVQNLVDHINISFLEIFSLMPKGSEILGKSQLNVSQVTGKRTARQYLQNTQILKKGK